MLIYVDAPKFLKVFRQEQSGDGVKRVRIGRLMKGSGEFRNDEGATLTSQEQADVLMAAEAFKGADRISGQADALRFPEVARRVAEYYADHASEFEKRLIAAATQEMARAIRKAAKDDTSTG